MKYLFTADVHCHAWTQFATRLPNGRNSRLEDCLSVFRQAAEICQAEKIDRFFILGDLFHSRTKIDVDVYYATWIAVSELAKVVPITILRGNHDCATKHDESNSIEQFKSICEVVDVPIGRDEPDGTSYYAIPWTDDPWKLRQLIQPVRMRQYDLLLLHQGIQEAAVGPYGMTGHGSISVSDLPLDNVNYVFAGDYHKRQFFGPGSRVHYIGSPCQLNFGEAGEEKAMTLWDNGVIRSIPTDAPRFFRCASLAEMEQRLASGEIRDGIDFVRIECSEKESAELTDRFSDCPTVQVEIQSEAREALLRVSSEVVASDSALLRAYVSQRSVYGDEFNERLVSLGLELLGME